MPIVLFPAGVPSPQLTDVRVSISSAATLAANRGKTVYVALQVSSTDLLGEKSTVVEQHAATGNRQVQHWIQVYRFRLASDPEAQRYTILVETGPFPTSVSAPISICAA